MFENHAFKRVTGDQLPIKHTYENSQELNRVEKCKANSQPIQKSNGNDASIHDSLYLQSERAICLTLLS